MGKLVEEIEPRARAKRAGQGDTLAIGHDGVVAAVDEENLGAERGEILVREIERRDLARNPRGQRGDERGHALGLAIVEERHHRPSLRAERLFERARIGVEVRELRPRDALEPLAVGGAVEPGRVREHEHPLAVAVGPA